MAIRGLTGWFGATLSAEDPVALARFYAALLGWTLTVKGTDAWLHKPRSTVYLEFSEDVAYEPPVWPSEPGRQGQQAHLDVGVSDLDAAVEDALALGARIAPHQPQEDVRVMLDPAGHPFCLYLDTE